MGNFRATTLGANTELLSLPFELPLEQWADRRIVHVPRGISRHIVRFVEVGGEVFAIKEATDRFVLREHGLLRSLAERSVPVVEAYGTVIERYDDDGAELGGLLITRHLQFSQPYRALFTGRGLPELRIGLLDALAGLFVRLHLAGFFWGDCSLSNTLVRRDAGALAAYLVDAETGELHSRLSNGQRAHDIDIATMNIAGELLDLQAAGLLGEDVDVGEMTINTEPRGMRLKFDPQVVDAGHHQRRLFELTGLRVQSNQARALLADLNRYKAKWEDDVGHPIWDDLAARRWLDEKFYSTLELVAPELQVKLPDAELFHEINEHRWLLSEDVGYDVGRAQAVKSYVTAVLQDLPGTRVDLSSGPPTEEFAPVFD